MDEEFYIFVMVLMIVTLGYVVGYMVGQAG